MYSFKEKKTYFNDLRNSDAAEFDIELLKKKNPTHPEIETFCRNPKRYSDELLYTLLDCATREEIREFRRFAMAEQEQLASNEPENGKPLAGTPTASDPQAEGTQSPTDEQDSADSQTEGSKSHTDAQESADNQIDSELEELKEALEEAEERADNAEQALEELEERAENAEQELEEEKKKEDQELAPQKSKNTKNTPK